MAKSLLDRDTQSADSFSQPFWLSLSAPETNTNQINFKPPFPSYPSGHATFGGAFFQSLRLFYKRRDNLKFADDEADNISFSATSDELNGISRDLRQPYVPTAPITDQLGTVRTDIGFRSYPSLWAAMFDNGISRVYLGVHWGFDAFAQSDVLKNGQTFNANGTVDYKNPKDITYKAMAGRGDRPGQQFPIGGVPLGIGIANDIFQSNIKPTPSARQPSGRNRCGDPLPKPTASGSASNGTSTGTSTGTSNGTSTGTSSGTSAGASNTTSTGLSNTASAGTPTGATNNAPNSRN